MVPTSITTTGDYNNTIFSGDGADQVTAMGGNDSIDAGNGDNNVHSGRGDDTITSGDGNDTIFSGDGDGDNLIKSGAGHDFIESDNGDDTIMAGTGNDSIDGGEDDDGNDIDQARFGVASSAFTATRDGDVYIITSAEGVDRVTNVEEFVFTDRTLSTADMDAVVRGSQEASDAAAGTGTDYTMSVGDMFSGRLHRSGDIDWVAISLTVGQTYTISLAGAGGGGGTLSDPYLRIYDGSGSFVTFDDDGGSGRDSQLTFTATASGTYYISAGAFSNRQAGSYTIGVTDISRDVQVAGTDGDDVITSGDGPDTINSGAGHDTINAGGGNDQIFSGRGNDDITSGAGNDSLDGGVGFDQARFGVAGGAFAVTKDGDAYIITSAEGVDRVTNVEEFVFGDTTLSAADMDALAEMQAGDPLLADGAGNDGLTGTEGADRINGGAGNDTITSGAGNDLIWSIGGNNSITSGDDNDSIFSGDGRDTIHAGDDNDLISSGGGHDTVNAGAGNDTITGGDGNDTIDGGAGADQVRFGVAIGDVSILKDGDDYLVVSEEGVDRVRNVERFVFSDTVLSAAEMDDRAVSVVASRFSDLTPGITRYYRTGDDQSSVFNNRPYHPSKFSV